MKDFVEKCFMRRIYTDEGTLSHGDYIRQEEGVIIRTDKDGLLNDNPDETGAPLPAIETMDGSHVEHWQHGKPHCDTGPAIIDVYDNYETWFFKGEKIMPKSQ